MGNHTPKINNLENYLKSHLGNELHWTLRAATEWHIQNTLKLNISGYHVQVYAMDATFVHARSLFEFFSQETTPNHYGYNMFNISQPSLVRYTDDWKNPLHAHMMHAQDRSRPQQLTSFDGYLKKDLNQMPVDFAKEIVRLWREFIILLSQNNDDLAYIAQNILDDAIDGAAKVFSRELKYHYMLKKLPTVSPIIWLQH